MHTRQGNTQMKTFQETGVNQEILKGVSALGFQKTTPVQAQVIPLMLQQQVDLICLAQTGTGKTAAFGLPLLQLIKTKKTTTQGLILCPTRELCMQVARDLQNFSRFINKLNILAIYGGASIEEQIRVLRKGVHIIVATPGRLNDLINRGKVNISEVRYVVFDEADEMLQMGFQDELNAILAQTPTEKYTLLFSATMSQEVRTIASRYMTNPVELTIGQRNAGAEHVNHEYYLVQNKNRYLALKRIVDNAPDNYSIIFCRTRRETNEVANSLIQDGYNADALHGDLSQAQRDQVMKKFRSKHLQLLVATDVAARGLDVNDLTHVINYNLPDDVAGYTHRSGRTGRAGRTGTSIALVDATMRYKIRQIEKKINKRFRQCRIPTGEEVCQQQLSKLIEGISNTEVNYEQLNPLYVDISKKLEHLDREELIKKFVSHEFNRFLDYYKYAPDLNISGKTSKKKAQKTRLPGGPSGKPGSRKNFTQFALNVGKRDGLMPQRVLGTINDATGNGQIQIGKIDIMRNRALLEADSRFTPQILEAFQNITINGKPVSIEVTKKKNNKHLSQRRRTKQDPGRKRPVQK